jgi:hypothetical protein
MTAYKSIHSLTPQKQRACLCIPIMLPRGFLLHPITEPYTILMIIPAPIPRLSLRAPDLNERSGSGPGRCFRALIPFMLWRPAARREVALLRQGNTPEWEDRNHVGGVLFRIWFSGCYAAA